MSEIFNVIFDIFHGENNNLFEPIEKISTFNHGLIYILYVNLQITMNTPFQVNHHQQETSYSLRIRHRFEVA